MEIQQLKVATRKTGGKGPAGRMRKAGVVPGIVYGGDGGPVNIQMEERAFERLLHTQWGEHAIVQLEVEDQPGFNSPALLKKVQYHPVRGNVLHADFLRIRLDQRIVTSVPVRLTGNAQGVVDGGVLDHQLRELQVECLVLEVPEQVLADVSALKINDSLHVSDLVLPENIRLVTDPGRTVAAVQAPRAVRAEEAEAAEGAVAAEGEKPEGEEAAEPEVISEKKREEREKKGKDKD